MRLSRRILLASSAAGAATAVPAAAWAQARVHQTLDADPFTLGVASGDPEPDGVVLWTRLAVNPLAEDGFGGMPDVAFDVHWEVARDERFRRRVAAGRAETAAAVGYSVHVEVEGLEPGREYCYRSHESEARWDVIGQQVFFTQRDADAGGPLRTSMDGWDGYAASRQRIIDGWVEAEVRNPVVLTGDVHTHWAGEILPDFPEAQGPSVGVELVATSITSGGNGADSVPEDNQALVINPHIKFRNAQRGYVETVITPDQMDVKFQVVPQVTVPGAPVYTRRSYSIADGDRTLHQTYDRPVDPATVSTDTRFFADSDELADDRLS